MLLDAWAKRFGVRSFAWSDDLIRRCADALKKTPDQIRAMEWHALRDALVISNNEKLAGEVVKSR